MVGLPQLDQRDAMLPLKTGGTAAAAFLLGAWLHQGYLGLKYGLYSMELYYYPWWMVSAVLPLCVGAAAVLATFPFRRRPYGWKSLYLPTAAACFAWGMAMAPDAHRVARILWETPWYLNTYDPQTVPAFFLTYGLLAALPAGVWVLGWGRMLNLVSRVWKRRV